MSNGLKIILLKVSHINSDDFLSYLGAALFSWEDVLDQVLFNILWNSSNIAMTYLILPSNIILWNTMNSYNITFSPKLVEFRLEDETVLYVNRSQRDDKVDLRSP